MAIGIALTEVGAGNGIRGSTPKTNTGHRENTDEIKDKIILNSFFTESRCYGGDMTSL